LLIIGFSVCTIPSFAQTTEEFTENDSLLTHTPRFNKSLGIGIVSGSLTKVETQYLSEGDRDISYDGIFTIGGRVSCGIKKYLLVDFTYLYAKDSKLAQTDSMHRPNKHNFFDLSAHWIANPESRVNYYATTGLSYVMNHYDEGGLPGYDQVFNAFGANLGIGMYINVDWFKFGLFTITAEWKIDVLFQRTTMNIMSADQKTTTQIERSTFYSVPQFGITFYPKF
jgi:hypothetical protein